MNKLLHNKIVELLENYGEELLDDEGIDIEVVTRVAEKLSSEFGYHIKIEAQATLETEYCDCFFVMLYAPDGQNSVCLLESEYTAEQMDQKDWDDFVQKAKELSQIWKVELEFEVAFEDYQEK